jgi:adenosine/AMP kinase
VDHYLVIIKFQIELNNLVWAAHNLLHILVMKTQQSSTVVGVFEDRVHANKAITELHQAGFDRNQIGVAMRHADGVENMTGTKHDTHATSGALAGALTGLGLGALAGLGVLAGVIPVVGPAIAAGTLGVVLSNAAAGAGIAGLVGALVGAGIPEDEAKYYQEELEAGRTIVTINAAGRADEVTAILHRCGGYDTSSQKSAALSL